MGPPHCCTFNCCDWNGLLSLNNYIDSLDICLIQEHSLHHYHLYKIREISSDFLCVNVSSMSGIYHYLVDYNIMVAVQYFIGIFDFRPKIIISFL